MITEADRSQILTSKEAFVFVGPPASGKTSHTNTFAEILDAKVVRGRNILPTLVPQYEGERSLIPDERFLPALQEVLERIGREEGVVFFDNIPRTVEQAHILLDWASKMSVKLHTVVLLLSKDEVFYRFQKRLACPKCGASYHPLLKPSQIEGKCDRDLADLRPRAGDKEDNVERSYGHYKHILERVVPVLEDGDSVHYINALGTVPETARIIAAKFNLESLIFKEKRGF